MQYPWPVTPLSRGWVIRTSILLDEPDYCAVEWMMNHFPGGLPSPQDYPVLARRWAEWMRETEMMEQNLSLWINTPPVRFCWWFFLASVGHYQLWKTLWQVRMNMDMNPESEITIDVHFRLSMIPMDAQWMASPVSHDDLLDRLSRSSSFDQVDTIFVLWRRIFWMVWRERSHLLPGHIRPWWGIRNSRLVLC